MWGKDILPQYIYIYIYIYIYMCVCVCVCVCVRKIQYVIHKKLNNYVLPVTAVWKFQYKRFKKYQNKYK